MNITQDDLVALYTLVEQYVLTKDNRDISVVRLHADGSMSAEYDAGCNEVEYIDIPFDALTADLEALAIERKKREEELRIEQIRLEQERKLRREVYEKNKRRELYENLKAEFGQE